MSQFLYIHTASLKWIQASFTKKLLVELILLVAISNVIIYTTNVVYIMTFEIYTTYVYIMTFEMAHCSPLINRGRMVND